MDIIDRMIALWESGWQHTLFGWEHPDYETDYLTLTEAEEYERSRQSETL